MTYLDRIVAAHRAAADDDPRDVDALVDAAHDAGPTRGFADALGNADGVGVIAEIKRRSPSKGDLKVDLDPAELAADYVRGGASCVSVLTDAGFFGGSAADLRVARESVGVPVLRKDFTVCVADICDARVMGADAVLLIVAALEDDELAELHALAVELGIDALVETHDEGEVARALAAGARMIGVNQRDLVTFEVDTDRAVRVLRAIPDDIIRVAESGIDGPQAAGRLADAGYDAVLVGESVVTSGDPVAAVQALVHANR